MILLSSPAIIVVIGAVLNALRHVHGTHFIFGGEAKRVCEAYKLICPVKKVCALQSIELPRTMNFPVCVHDTHVVVKSDICRKPPIPGRCQAQFMRWYFNVHMGTCSWFTYSGCGGNQNKFRTAEECERRCMGTKNELLEEKKRGQNGTTSEMDNVSVGENLADAQKELLEEGREPKLIRAPARAAEMIDLTNDITSSLQLGSHSSNATLTLKEEKKKRRREREKRKRQKNKHNKNKTKHNSRHIKKVEYSTTTESVQTISFLKLDSNMKEEHSTLTIVTETPNLAELKSRQTTFSRFGLSNPEEKPVWMIEKPVWMIDKQFRKRGKKYRNKSKEPATKSRSDTLDVYSGAKQDTYYDKVKLFDILTNQAKEQTNQV
ncbi:hypothetical protein BsWGS_25536 [Bradybaena similaris]